MLIANPIYDVVFKRLMEHTPTAKFFIETLLSETLESIFVSPQEFTFTEAGMKLTVLRFDYIATIRTANGEFKKVLIEIQKSRNADDMHRFRKYLATQYMKTDEVVLADSGVQPVILPIITIYLLGFSLSELPSAVVKSNHHYIDLLTHKDIIVKSDFFEKLTHEMYVVQLNKIDVKLSNRLEKLLSVFEQRYFINGDNAVKEYNHPIDDENIKGMLEILNYECTDPKRRKEIEDEKDFFRMFNIEIAAKRREVEQKLHLAEKELMKTEAALQQKETALQEKEQALQEKAIENEALRKQIEALNGNSK